MGFDVLRAGVDNVDAWLVTYTNDIASSLQAVTEGAQELSGLASFTGSAAEAVKAYWGEAHVLATAAIALAGMELAMRCTEYAQGYDGIDANKNARFSQDALETTSTDYQGKQTDFADKDARLKTAVDAVSDLIGSWTPSAAAITDNLSSLATDPSTLCSSVSAYEATSASGLAVSVDALLADAQSLVELLTAGTGGAAYVPGTIASQPWAADLYAAIQTSQTYQEEHSAAYEAAIAGLQGRMQERYDEYVAAEAEARRQAGIVEMGTAVLAVLAGRPPSSSRQAPPRRSWSGSSPSRRPSRPPTSSRATTTSSWAPQATSRPRRSTRSATRSSSATRRSTTGRHSWRRRRARSPFPWAASWARRAPP